MADNSAVTLHGSLLKINSWWKFYQMPLYVMELKQNQCSNLWHSLVTFTCVA